MMPLCFFGLFVCRFSFGAPALGEAGDGDEGDDGDDEEKDAAPFPPAAAAAPCPPLSLLTQQQMGQRLGLWFLATQCSRPMKIICRCSLFQDASGNRRRSAALTLLGSRSSRRSVRPQRRAQRWMCVSTGNDGTPNACARTFGSE